MFFNGAHVHLLVNHIPVIGFLGIVIGLAIATRSPSLHVKKFVLLATFLVGISALSSYFTGDSAEEIIENFQGVNKNLIREHEEWALKATILAMVTAFAAGIGWILQVRQPESLKKSVPFVLVLSIAAAILMVLAAHEGGKIRHPKIMKTSTSACVTTKEDDHESKKDSD